MIHSDLTIKEIKNKIDNKKEISISENDEIVGYKQTFGGFEILIKRYEGNGCYTYDWDNYKDKKLLSDVYKYNIELLLHDDFPYLSAGTRQVLKEKFQEVLNNIQKRYKIEV